MSAFDPKRTLGNSFASAPIGYEQISVSNDECLQDQVVIAS